MMTARHIETQWIGGGFYSDALWTRDLPEDADDDDLMAIWPHPGEMLKVTAKIEERIVGSAEFSYLAQSHGGHLACFNIYVPEEHRQSGIATALYNMAEEVLGDQVLPYPGNEGGAIKKFWMDRLKNNPDCLRTRAEDIGVSSAEVETFLAEQPPGCHGP